MYYTEHFQTRWHDTNAAHELRPSAVLMFMQETANRQMLVGGNHVDRLRTEQGLAFILSRVTLQFYAPIHCWEDIDSQTWICPSRGYSFGRDFRILHKGAPVAEGVSIWALVKVDDKSLCRVEDFDFGFTPEEALPFACPRRVRYPGDVKKVGERKILWSDIDSNGHMNNTHYPDMLMDYMENPAERELTSMSLSFIHEAAYGHTLDIYCAETEGLTCFRADDAGTICLEAEVHWKPKT